MKLKIAVVLVLGAIAAQKSSASTIIMLGDVSFTDQTQQNAGAFSTADTGELAPFNGVACGADASANCSTSWTFTYSLPVGETITGATFTLGIADLDTHATGNQIGTMTIGGIDIAGLMNTVAESIDPSVGICPGSPGGTNNCWGSIYRVLTITLPSTTFAQLATGTATVNFATSGPGWGVLGGVGTTFNGVNLDYSSLDISTSPVVATPEPGSLFSMAAGLAGLGLLRYRRRKQ
jgi:hypothetical protein